MTTTVSLPSPRSSSRRTQILASASALVAAASVAVTLAVAGSDGAGSARVTGAPAPAKPNAATQYRNDVAAEHGSRQAGGASAAERFHHFR
jgi:hypothetical protein